MKLEWEDSLDTFRLIEDDKSDIGYSVICTSETPSEFASSTVDIYSKTFSMLAFTCGHPSEPDIWDNIHGYLSKDPYIKIIEAEPIEYPEDAVF